MADQLPAPIDIQKGILGAVIWIVVLTVILTDQGVFTDGHAVVESKFLFFFLVERRAGKADDDYDYTEMDDISAVSPGIAMSQLHCRSEQIRPVVPRNHSCAAEEF